MIGVQGGDYYSPMKYEDRRILELKLKNVLSPIEKLELQKLQQSYE